MKIRITKPIRVNALGGEVEVSDEEFKRLLLLGAAEPLIVKKTEKVVKEKKIVGE